VKKPVNSQPTQSNRKYVESYNQEKTQEVQLDQGELEKLQIYIKAVKEYLKFSKSKPEYKVYSEEDKAYIRQYPKVGYYHDKSFEQYMSYLQDEKKMKEALHKTVEEFKYQKENIRKVNFADIYNQFSEYSSYSKIYKLLESIVKSNQLSTTKGSSNVGQIIATQDVIKNPVDTLSKENLESYIKYLEDYINRQANKK
jgi:hypothetical protein